MLLQSPNDLPSAPSAGFHREIAWFAVVLLLCRWTHGALAALRLRWLLAPLGVLVHFGCWGGNCPWPLARDPFDLKLISAVRSGTTPAP